MAEYPSVNAKTGHRFMPSCGDNVSIHYLVSGPSMRSTRGEVIAFERDTGLCSVRVGSGTGAETVMSGVKRASHYAAPDANSPETLFPCWAAVAQSERS
jgi:hypothetical protein